MDERNTLLIEKMKRVRVKIKPGKYKTISPRKVFHKYGILLSVSMGIVLGITEKSIFAGIVSTIFFYFIGYLWYVSGSKSYPTHIEFQEEGIYIDQFIPFACILRIERGGNVGNFEYEIIYTEGNEEKSSKMPRLVNNMADLILSYLVTELKIECNANIGPIPP